MGRGSVVLFSARTCTMCEKITDFRNRSSTMEIIIIRNALMYSGLAVLIQYRNRICPFPVSNSQTCIHTLSECLKTHVSHIYVPSPSTEIPSDEFSVEAVFNLFEKARALATVSMHPSELNVCCVRPILIAQHYIRNEPSTSSRQCVGDSHSSF